MFTIHPQLYIAAGLSAAPQWAVRRAECAPSLSAEFLSCKCFGFGCVSLAIPSGKCKWLSVLLLYLNTPLSSDIFIRHHQQGSLASFPHVYMHQWLIYITNAAKMRISRSCTTWSRSSKNELQDPPWLHLCIK